jgi:hypothetical protein
MLLGHPALHLDSLPGTAWVVLLGAVVALAGAVRWALRSGRPLTGEQRLLVAIGVATPIGLLAYSGLGTNIYSPRNLSASAPALSVLLAALVAGLPRRAAAPAAACVVAVFAAGAVKVLDDSSQRPAYRQVAAFIRDHRHPGDAVIDSARSQMVVGSTSPSYIGPYLPERGRTSASTGDPAAWDPAEHGHSVFVIAARDGYFVGLPPLGGPGYRYVLREGRSFRGIVGLSVGRYAGRVRGRLVGSDSTLRIRWSLASDVPVSTTAAEGRVDAIEGGEGETTFTGWATGRGGGRIPDWVLAFAGRRLVAVGRTVIPRPDIERVYGRAVLPSGFRMTIGGRRLVRLYAVTPDGATPLALTPPAEVDRRALRLAG